MTPEDVQAAARERLRRAGEDGQRLYEKRMHDEPTIRDDNRIDGILTLDLQDALGAFDAIASGLAAETARADAAEQALAKIAPDVHLVLEDYYSGCQEEREAAAPAWVNLTIVFEYENEEGEQLLRETPDIIAAALARYDSARNSE